MNNKFYTVCGIVEIENKILFVRHTYGTAKDRILLPGGFVTEGELPSVAAERELLEETGVTAKAKSIMAMQFKPEQWCAVFVMEYVSGIPKSDGYENSEVLLLTAEEALARKDITNMSKEMIRIYSTKNYGELNRNSYVPGSVTEDNYVLFGDNV
ncbi:MAG: NUDIX hydrolase [Ruminococcaceae bacterium]|nr:NUDIX hydrolase [Oscillospiraceae bacterium]